MENIYRTLVKKDVELRESYEYALGTVNGILLTECVLPYGFTGDLPMVIESGTVLTTQCEEEAYRDFKCIVEWLYPELCEFYYELT